MMLAPAALLALAIGTPPAFEQTDETRRMVERLERVAIAVEDPTNLYANRTRVAAMTARLQTVGGDARAERVSRFVLGMDHLRAGDTDEAIAAFERVLKLIEASPEPMPRNRRAATRYLALAHLRRGEQENCLARHSTESCIFPIAGSGVHALPRGSRAAIDLFQTLLAEDGDDLASRWLLNLAYQTLGEHPGEVPEPWLIDQTHFESAHDVGRFRDVAPALGIATIGHAGGVVVEDFDGDGLLDIMVSSWGARDPLRLYMARADGTYEERSEAAGLAGLNGGLNLVHADYDNDGDADVLVLRGAWFGAFGAQPNSLLRNRGDGTFDDVTWSAGLRTMAPTQTAVWSDLDRDGDLDLVIGHESDRERRHPCELHLNQGDGTFVECGAAAGVAHLGYVKAVVAGDIDGDGDDDLYYSCDGEPNVMFRNEGVGADGVPIFRDITREAGVAEPVESFPAWFFDYDADGDEDLFVAGYGVDSIGDVAAGVLGAPHDAALPRLYRNRGDGTFENVTHDAGLDVVTLPMGANYGDLDGDGWLDLYLGTGEPELSALMPNLMFRGTSRGVFEDVTTSGGFGHLQKGHGVAFADLDHDGDQDVYSVIGGAFEGDVGFNVLFENPGHDRHWITLVLEGTRSARCAIGARITIELDGRTIHRTVRTGGSFGSTTLRQHIGLGDADQIEGITVRWPTGGMQRVAGILPVDGAWRIVERDATLHPIELPSFQFATDGSPHQHHHHHHEE